MPDEPTSGAGDTGSSSTPSVRAERADEPTRPSPRKDPRPTPPTEAVPSRTAAASVGPPTVGAEPVPERPQPAGRAEPQGADGGRRAREPRRGRVRARKVRRIVRHVEPWSVLKISILFYAALFVIVAVASGILWSAARSAGTIDDVESFITEVGGFGTCEPIDGAAGPATTTTTEPTGELEPPDQFDPTGTETTVAPGEVPVDPELEEDEDGDGCREGERLVGEFRFEDSKIRQAFLLGGVVLVLAGSALNVILTLLFNLMSDLTGGVRVTVLEVDPAARTSRPDSPDAARRG